MQEFEAWIADYEAGKIRFADKDGFHRDEVDRIAHGRVGSHELAQCVLSRVG